MVAVVFTEDMPSGLRLHELFTAAIGPISYGAGSADLHVMVYSDPVAVRYSGTPITAAEGNVSLLRFGPSGAPWLTYGSLGGPAFFSYKNLSSFQQSGVAAAAIAMQGEDSLTGSANGDYMDAYAGNDTLDGGPGADTLDGGTGNDTYFVDNVNDRVIENIGGGYDVVWTKVSFSLAATSEVEELRAGTGTYSLALTGSALRNLIFGTPGDDTLDGAGGTDWLSGGAGDDTYIVNSPDDQIVENASAGFDTVLTRTSFALGDNLEVLKAVWGVTVPSLMGNSLNNEILGNAGANALFGFDGNDSLYGDGGDDKLYGGNGHDTLYGGIGNDWLDGGAGHDRLYGDTGNDRLRGFDGNDRLYGGTGNDTLYGDKGNDLLYGDTGNDKLLGGVGNDKLYGGMGRNTLSGGDGNDYLYGGAQVDILYGDNGNDRIYGDAGNDVLYGGLGNDTLSGGYGRDTFVFNTRLNGSKNVDRIVDFKSGQDRIKLDDAVFKGIPRGTLGVDTFHIGPSAQDPSDRIVYNAGNGYLFYDPDGSGPASPVRFAILKAGLPLQYSDFYVF